MNSNTNDTYTAIAVNWATMLNNGTNAIEAIFNLQDFMNDKQISRDEQIAILQNLTLDSEVISYDVAS